MTENETTPKNTTKAKKTQQTQKSAEIETSAMAKCKLPFSLNKVLDALMMTYPDDFPWGGDGTLLAITGGDIITVELGKVMS